MKKGTFGACILCRAYEGLLDGNVVKSRTLKTLQRDGFVPFARKVFRDKVFATENFAEITLSLDELLRPKAIDRIRLDIEWARRPEDASILFDSFPKKRDLFNKYFDEGAFATFSLKDGAVSGYNWIIAKDFFDFAFSKRLIEVPSGGFLTFDGYVEPKWRGQAIAPVVMSAFLEQLKADGFRTAHAAVSERNIPSLRLHAMFGYRSSGSAFNVHHLFGTRWSTTASPNCRVEDYQRRHRHAG